MALLIHPPNRSRTLSQNLALCLNQKRILLTRELAERQSALLQSSHLHLLLRLTGTLDYAVLESTVNEIIRRHSGLRLTFFPNPAIPSEEHESRLSLWARTGIIPPGLYLQSVAETASAGLDTIDLTGMEPSAQKTEFARVFGNEAALPFESPPLVRASLVKVGHQDHLLLLTLDHLSGDSWSLGVLGKEIEAIYSSFLSGEPSKLAEAPLGFPDFAIWQNECFNTQHFDRAITYWQREWSRFGSARIGFADLPFSLPPPKTPGTRFRDAILYFEPELAETIREFARSLRSSIFVVFVTALAILLHCYTGMKRFAIWAHFANRNRTEFQHAIGYFANTHILGIDIDPGDPVSAPLNGIRQTVLSATAHQDLPLAHLWRALKCHPRFADTAILMDFRSTTRSSGVSVHPGKRLSITEVPLPDLSSPRFSNLGVYVIDNREQIWLRAQYSANHFPESAVRFLLEDLRSVVCRITRDPAAKVSSFSEIAGRYPARAGRCDSSMEEFLVMGSHLIPSPGLNTAE